MTTLEPRQVEIADITGWIKESLDLMTRRAVLFVAVVTIYCFLIYFSVQAIIPLTFYVPMLFLAVAFLLYAAFILFFVLASFIVLAYCSDKSQSMPVGRVMSILLPEQKSLFRMAFMALFVGAAIWILNLSFDKELNLVSACERIVEKMVVTQDEPYQFIFQITASMLYFLILSLFALRIYFSIPLVIFHGLDYKEAQVLSHRAILMNIKPMSMALVLWIILFIGTLKGAFLLAILLFPLLGAFLYISYRHIFLGQLRNDSARKVERAASAHTLADVKE